MIINSLANARRGCGIRRFLPSRLSAIPSRLSVIIVAAVGMSCSMWPAFIAAAAPPSASPQVSTAAKTSSPEEAAILSVVDQFMTGISTNDFALLARIRLENSLNVVERPASPPATGTVITRRPFNPEGSKPGAFKERYWDPVVLVRGGLAVVWAPYEFWRDDKTSHCGVDVFELVKEQGTWKIGNAMWTVEPDACPSLRPSDLSRMRPQLPVR